MVYSCNLLLSERGNFIVNNGCNNWFTLFPRTELSRFQQELAKLPGKRNRLDTKLNQMRIDEFVSTFLNLLLVHQPILV